MFQRCSFTLFFSIDVLLPCSVPTLFCSIDVLLFCSNAILFQRYSVPAMFCFIDVIFPGSVPTLFFSSDVLLLCYVPSMLFCSVMFQLYSVPSMFLCSIEALLLSNVANVAVVQIAELTQSLVLSTPTLEEVSCLLLREFKAGLAQATHEAATVKMYPTYVRDVPNGSEHGKFLALDLGGTNFRVLLIDLDGDVFKMENEIYAIPQEIMLGSGEQDLICQDFDLSGFCSCRDFVNLTVGLRSCSTTSPTVWPTSQRSRGVKNIKLPLGFTFSFPCRQEGLTSARLTNWTKGFKCSGVIGEDVVQLLRQAVLRRQDVDIDVVAVVNDTTGTLMSCAHRNRRCRLGLIVGTGTNACYMEQLDEVELFDETKQKSNGQPKQMIVNTEWGAFGDNGCLSFIRTPYDEAIDRQSLNPGRQLFEKMISGMYMGELVRQILVHAAYKGLLFEGKLSPQLEKPYSFKTKYVSYIEGEKATNDVVRQILKELGITCSLSDDECEAIRLICQRVSTRAAHLVSAAAATVLNKMKRNHTTVGVDGSVYRYHPHFHNLMVAKIGELTQPDYKVSTFIDHSSSA
ncbi:GCK [Cordylochernes scorpioides]|uniref:Phosphotransferase n=1 Tax=Cordylochernes scorpioides TaxID=51811 RepID=A0ABY6KJI5_9ARAC|nr:GCK [Cordylochernes scorpioides]